ncbi:MAG: hypothetical protein E6K54_02640 [Gammaproteobacteria bacterium]|nr:MAG: hypothetical protein E6K54_02640 [Gammaproteobacteria bacterium]
MKNNTCLTYKDLKKMDQLLEAPTSVESKHNLTELDQLAIKVIADIHQYPTRFFYNLRGFDNKEEKYSENSREPLNLVNAR